MEGVVDGVADGARDGTEVAGVAGSGFCFPAGGQPDEEDDGEGAEEEPGEEACGEGLGVEGGSGLGEW